MEKIFSRDDVAAELFGQNHDMKTWDKLPIAYRQPYFDQADLVIPLLRKSYDEGLMQGFVDGVQSAQSMVGFTDESVESVLGKEGDSYLRLYNNEA